jgi:plastocyanin
VQPLPTAVVRSQATAQPLAGASVAALAAQLAESAQTLYDVVTASVLGQANPTTTGADGGYSFAAPAGTYRLDVAQSGYQPYRTANIDVEAGALAVDVALAPVVAGAATHTVYMTASGFEPATLAVQPGSVVEFVNLDLAEHGARHASAWDSGVLATGGRFQVKLNTAGTFAYADVADALTQGVIEVAADAPAARSLYLPVVTR